MAKLANLARATVLGLLLGGIGAAASGCAAIGYVAAVMPQRPVAAAYKGLAGQSVAVMVWVDRPIRIDNPTLQLDIANGIQQKLEAAKKDDKEELKLTTFPIEPRSVVRYQAEHPEMEARPVTETTPVLNVTRVIYVEILDFQTRPNAALDMYRGVMLAAVKVVEIDEKGKAKLAYDEGEVRAIFPKKSPVDGVPSSNDLKIYGGTLDEFTTTVAERFYTHSVEE